MGHSNSAATIQEWRRADPVHHCEWPGCTKVGHYGTKYAKRVCETCCQHCITAEPIWLCDNHDKHSATILICPNIVEYPKCEFNGDITIYKFPFVGREYKYFCYSKTTKTYYDLVDNKYYKYVQIKSNFYYIVEAKYENTSVYNAITYNNIRARDSCGTLTYDSSHCRVYDANTSVQTLNSIADEPMTGPPAVTSALSFAPRPIAPTETYDPSATFASALKAAEEAAKGL